MRPVIFVICLQNYNGFKGFRLNKAKYSSHHHDEELLLLDGVTMFVVNVEELVFETEVESLLQFNNKTFTIVYLFNLD